MGEQLFCPCRLQFRTRSSRYSLRPNCAVFAYYLSSFWLDPMSECLESSKWKMHLHRNISTSTAVVLVWCVVAAGILSTDALPASKIISATSQPHVAHLILQSDIASRPETAADPKESNSISL